MSSLCPHHVAKGPLLSCILRLLGMQQVLGDVTFSFQTESLIREGMTLIGLCPAGLEPA